jgi:hypothetical protein
VKTAGPFLLTQPAADTSLLQFLQTLIAGPKSGQALNTTAPDFPGPLAWQSAGNRQQHRHTDY